MTNAALRGKPDAGNPHVRFDEGEVASAATPRRGSLLYKELAWKLILSNLREVIEELDEIHVRLHFLDYSLVKMAEGFAILLPYRVKTNNNK